MTGRRRTGESMSVETGVQPALSQSSAGQSEAPTQHQISSETITHKLLMKQQ